LAEDEELNELYNIYTDKKNFEVVKNLVRDGFEEKAIEFVKQLL